MLAFGFSGGKKKEEWQKQTATKVVVCFHDICPMPPTSCPPSSHVLCCSPHQVMKMNHKVSWLISLRIGWASHFLPPLVFLPTPHSSVENNSQPTSLGRGEGQKAGMLRWMMNHHHHCHHHRISLSLLFWSPPSSPPYATWWATHIPLERGAVMLVSSLLRELRYCWMSPHPSTEGRGSCPCIWVWLGAKCRGKGKCGGGGRGENEWTSDVVDGWLKLHSPSKIVFDMNTHEPDNK